MGYLYETHLHTCEASKCGRVHGEDYISYMMDKGYSGMIVTDHFFTGNSKGKGQHFRKYAGKQKRCPADDHACLKGAGI